MWLHYDSKYFFSSIKKKSSQTKAYIWLTRRAYHKAKLHNKYECKHNLCVRDHPYITPVYLWTVSDQLTQSTSVKIVLDVTKNCCFLTLPTQSLRNIEMVPNVKSLQIMISNCIVLPCFNICYMSVVIRNWYILHNGMN